MIRRSLLSTPSAALIGLFSLALAAAACTPEKPATGPEQPKPAASPTASGKADAGRGPDPYQPVGPFADEVFATVDSAPLAAGALVLAAAPAGVAPAPAVCAEYLKSKPAAAPACADRAAALAALDHAVAIQNATGYDARTASAGNARDAALAALESCAGLPAGMVRALRIDLLPVGCGDVLAEPLLKAPPKELRGDLHEALFGMALAARLSRAGGVLPQMAAPFTEERVKKHIGGPVAKWMKDVSVAVEEISGAAAKLHFYGGAIAAVAAGVADMQLVEAVRAVPIPDEYQKDEERKNIYYAALDERLEPRKRRGGDAALVGLKKFAEVGAIADERVREARRLLSKLYGGRRIDALDRLILPAIPAAAGRSAGSADERLAGRLPTFYAGLLLEPQVVSQPAVMTAFAAQGLPLPQRKALHDAAPGAELAPLAARARLARGRVYWRAVDFEEAAKAMAIPPAAGRGAESKLLAGLAIALRGGPRDAVEMMTAGVHLGGSRAALDALTAEAVPLSGAAAFDAAYLMEIAAPERADGLFFKSVAKRYHAAAGLLTEPRQKADAEERARSVELIAGEVK